MNSKILSVMIVVTAGGVLWFYTNQDHLNFSNNTSEKVFVPRNVEVKPMITESQSIISDDQYPDQIIFVGDIMLGRHVEYLMLENGAEYPFKNLSFLKMNQSYVVGNFEGSVPERHQKTPNFGFTFSINKNYLPQLYKSGFTHLSLANNHAHDFGLSGLINTEKELLANNLIPFGQPKNFSSSSITVLPTIAGQVALVGMEVLSGVPSQSDLFALMTEATRLSDWQVVYIHWGAEYQPIPSNHQEALATQLIGLGADLIIGHHPHVIQSIDLIDGVPIFYSLGNFIFDQYFSTDVQQGLSLKVNFETEKILIELLPVTSIDTKAQPRLMNLAEKELFLEELADRSSLGLASMVRGGEVIIDSRLASSTEIAIMEQ